MQLGRFRVGFHKYGNCWRWRFGRQYYYGDEMTWYSFWRFFFVIDRRFAATT